jgi:solute carrier family 25 oxoglutarate transporter 11
LVKSRLMNQRIDPLTGKLPYSGIVDATMQIATKEGPLGFFNGFSAYYGRCAPHAMIILLSIESITSFYQKGMY